MPPLGPTESQIQIKKALLERRQLDGRAFSLNAMYKTATGSWSDQRHTALGDARAVREVLLWLLRNAPKSLYLPQGQSAATGRTSEHCPVSSRPVPLTRCSVAELLDSFPQSPAAGRRVHR